MKILLIILTFWIFNIQHLSAQTFVNTDNKWYISDCCVEQFGEIGCTTYQYEFGNPVLIDQIEYHPLITENQGQFMPLGQYYRQAGDQVFMKILENSAEQLIYDFGLAVGETVIIGNDDGPGPLQIQCLAIDTVTLSSGAQRKRLAIASNPGFSEELYWIEGIGSTYATMNTNYMSTLDCWMGLSCFFQSNDIEFQPAAECVLSSTESESYNSNSFSAYPNPANNSIRIKETVDQIDQLQLFDTKGKTILAQATAIATPDISIDVSGLPSGIYFLKAFFKNGKTSVQKIIKE